MTKDITLIDILKFCFFVIVTMIMILSVSMYYHAVYKEYTDPFSLFEISPWYTALGIILVIVLQIWQFKRDIILKSINALIAGIIVLLIANEFTITFFVTIYKYFDNSTAKFIIMLLSATSTIIFTIASGWHGYNIYQKTKPPLE
ncbi:MAG: hypothetical protein ABH884_03545 [Candidatus Komeilibacteria bacterium]